MLERHKLPQFGYKQQISTTNFTKLKNWEQRVDNSGRKQKIMLLSKLILPSAAYITSVLISGFQGPLETEGLYNNISLQQYTAKYSSFMSHSVS